MKNPIIVFLSIIYSSLLLNGCSQNNSNSPKELKIKALTTLQIEYLNNYESGDKEIVKNMIETICEYDSLGHILDSTVISDINMPYLSRQHYFNKYKFRYNSNWELINLSVENDKGYTLSNTFYSYDSVNNIISKDFSPTSDADKNIPRILTKYEYDYYK